MRPPRALIAILLLLLTVGTARPGPQALAQAPPTTGAGAGTGPYTPNIAEASDAAERAIKGFRVAPGLKVELFAAEPLLANPVAFSIDARNRFYIAETFRYHAGVTETGGT